MAALMPALEGHHLLGLFGKHQCTAAAGMCAHLELKQCLCRW